MWSSRCIGLFFDICKRSCRRLGSSDVQDLHDAANRYIRCANILGSRVADCGFHHYEIAGPWGYSFVLFRAPTQRTPTLRKSRCGETSNSSSQGVPEKPKLHSFRHLVSRALVQGNPDYYATRADESINAVIANIARAAHRSVWEARCMEYFERGSSTREPKRRRIG